MFVPFTSLSQQKESKMNMVDGTTSTVDEGVPLPGFRFHPTEEELVGFYLRQKVDNKCLTIELIKEIDIYKYDPSDLPSTFLNHYYHSHMNFDMLMISFIYTRRNWHDGRERLVFLL